MKKEKSKEVKELDKQSINLTELKIQENISKLIGYIPQILKFLEKKLLLHEAPIAKSTIRGFLAIVFIILIGSFVLVFANKLDSSSLTLIIGTILGYLLSVAKMFIRREED